VWRCYAEAVPEWMPSTASAKGRLVLAALDAFGRDGFPAVRVGDARHRVAGRDRVRRGRADPDDVRRALRRVAA
jgi:hypothetical protein